LPGLASNGKPPNHGKENRSPERLGYLSRVTQLRFEGQKEIFNTSVGRGEVVPHRRAPAQQDLGKSKWGILLYGTIQPRGACRTQCTGPGRCQLRVARGRTPVGGDMKAKVALQSSPLAVDRCAPRGSDPALPGGRDRTFPRGGGPGAGRGRGRAQVPSQ
jgi:hypothetical protein